MAKKSDSNGAAEALQASVEAPDASLVLGGEWVEVTFRDGTTERVWVRELTIRELMEGTIFTLVANEPALVEYYCARQEGWADTLVGASHSQIMEVGEKLNHPILAGWATRRKATGDFIAPLARMVTVAMQDTLRPFMASLAKALQPGSVDTTK